MLNKIEAFMTQEKDQMIQDLITLIGYPSISGDMNQNSRCLDAFLAMAQDLGFKTKKTSYGDVGIVEYGQGRETIGILAHLDVVAVGDIRKWEHDPFEGFIKDGYVWGRGAADNKNGAIAALYALKALKYLGLPMKKKIQVIIGTSEESEWTDMEHFKAEFPCPDYGFTPDGEFPIFNREKGYADVELIFPAIKTSDVEILAIYTENSGNTVPSQATISLKLSGDQYDRIKGIKHPKMKIEEEGLNLLNFLFSGISVHSSQPEKGDNAICNMCEILGEYLDLPLFSFVKEFFVGDIYGKKLEISGQNEYYKGEHIGQTTAVPTTISLKNGAVHLGVNIRQKYGTTENHIREAFGRHQNGYDYEIAMHLLLDPIMISENLPIMKSMAEAYEAWNFKNSFALAAGTTYAKAMKNIVAWGPLFPDDLDTTHEENERMSIDSLCNATKIYITFLSKTAVTEQSLL